MIVSNTSPLIVLGKIGKLNLLKACFSKVLIPLAVYEEVMAKKENIEARALDRAIGERWLIVEREIVNPEETSMLGRGERQAIALAAQKKLKLLIDDDVAKAHASLQQVEAHGTLYVLAQAFQKKIITKKEIEVIFQEMLSVGFYVSTEVYAKIVEKVS